MFAEAFFPLPDSFTSSPYFIVFTVIVVPLIGFALYLRFFLRRGTASAAEALQAAKTQQAVPPTTYTAAQPDRVEELAKAVGQLGSKMDRVEANVTKAVAGGFSEVMGELRSLSQKLEDAVLAVKAAQSDAASPFNEQPQQPEGRGLREAIPLDRSGSSESGPFGNELGGYDVGRLLEACAVLEILGYNRRQVELLFEVGVLGVEHLELIGRVERVLEKYGSGLRARDVAEIVLKTCPPQATSQQGVVRVLRVLRELGGRDGGRSGE